MKTNIFAFLVITTVLSLFIWMCSKAIDDSEIMIAQLSAPPSEMKISTNSSDPTIQAMTTGMKIGPPCPWNSLYLIGFDVVQIDAAMSNVRQIDWVSLNNQLTTLLYGKVKTHTISGIKAIHAIDPTKTIPGWSFGVVNAGPYEIGVAYKDLGGYYQVSFCKFMRWK